MTRRRLADRYELVVRRGSGGMAEVWEGVDHNLGRRIAIKVLHPHLAANNSVLNRFRSEAQAAARLTHPGIVSIYDTVTTDDTDAIIMELVEGSDLRTLLDERPTLALADAAEVGIQVAAALGHAHQNGIIHRDVKPANILVRPDRRVKLSDFGIAKALDQTGHTESGSLVGTVKYLAPEQLEGVTADARTDLYSLSTLLYEMLCGEVPFAATDLMSAMRRVQVDAPSARTIRPDLSPTVDQFLLRGLARDPTARYPTANAWSQALTDAISGDATMVDSAKSASAPKSIPIRPAPEINPTPQSPTPAPAPRLKPATASSPPGPQRPRKSPAKADPAVAKHHQRNRTRLSVLGPVAAILLAVAAVATVWLLLSGSNTSVDSTGEPDDQVESAEEVVESNDEVTSTTTSVVDPDGDTTTPQVTTDEAATATSTTELVETTTSTSIPDFVNGQRTIAFDPFGGDGEHDDLAPLAIDGNPATFWNTQSYRTRTFGNIKDGVGLIVEFEAPQDVSQMMVSTSRVGWAARIYRTDVIADDLAGWGEPIGNFTELNQNATLNFPADSTSAVLFWLTDLGLDPNESLENYDAEVAEGGFDQRIEIFELSVS